jgi:hypothetical protein
MEEGNKLICIPTFTWNNKINFFLALLPTTNTFLLTRIRKHCQFPRHRPWWTDGSTFWIIYTDNELTYEIGMACNYILFISWGIKMDWFISTYKKKLVLLLQGAIFRYHDREHAVYNCNLGDFFLLWYYAVVPWKSTHVTTSLLRARRQNPSKKSLWKLQILIIKYQHQYTWLYFRILGTEYDRK